MSRDVAVRSYAPVTNRSEHLHHVLALLVLDVGQRLQRRRDVVLLERVLDALLLNLFGVADGRGPLAAELWLDYLLKPAIMAKHRLLLLEVFVNQRHARICWLNPSITLNSVQTSTIRRY